MNLANVVIFSTESTRIIVFNSGTSVTFCSRGSFFGFGSKRANSVCWNHKFFIHICYKCCSGKLICSLCCECSTTSTGGYQYTYTHMYIAHIYVYLSVCLSVCRPHENRLRMCCCRFKWWYLSVNSAHIEAPRPVKIRVWRHARLHRKSSPRWIMGQACVRWCTAVSSSHEALPYHSLFNLAFSVTNKPHRGLLQFSWMQKVLNVS